MLAWKLYSDDHTGKLVSNVDWVTSCWMDFNGGNPDIIVPSPASLWVTADEHPDCINNGDMSVKYDAVGAAAQIAE